MKSILHKLTVLSCMLVFVPPGLAQDLVDDLSFRVADAPSGIPLERAEEIVYPDGAQQWIVECNELDTVAICGFYRELKAFFRQGAIRNTFNMPGAFLRVRTDVPYYTRLDLSQDAEAPFHNSWSADVDLTYVFYLKRKTEFGIEMDGAEAAVLNGVKTSVLRRRVYAFVDWNALSRTLAVTVVDFDNPYDMGTQFESGPILITGRSVSSTLSKKYSLNSHFSTEKKSEDSAKSKDVNKIEIGATHYTKNSKRRMKVTIEGATYYAEFGRFSATDIYFSDGRHRLEFAFGANWVSDSDIEYEEVADYTHVQCESSKKFDFGFSFVDFITGASSDTSGETTCIANANQLPVHVSWSAVPTLDENTMQHEGLFSVARFVTEADGNGGAKAWYQPRFSSKMTWRFHAYVTEGSGPGYRCPQCRYGSP